MAWCLVKHKEKFTFYLYLTTSEDTTSISLATKGYNSTAENYIKQSSKFAQKLYPQ
jgi:hypothetical protein